MSDKKGGAFTQPGTGVIDINTPEENVIEEEVEAAKKASFCTKMGEGIKQEGHDFRDFTFSWSVITIAVGLLISTALTGVINSLTNDVILAFVAAIVGDVQFEELHFTINGTDIFYGKFIQSIIELFFTAIAIWVCLGRPMKYIKNKKEAQDDIIEKEKKDAEYHCHDCLEVIPEEAIRCKYCGIKQVKSSPVDIADSSSESLQIKKNQ